MLISLMEDVNPQQVVGKSLPILGAYAARTSNEYAEQNVVALRLKRIAQFGPDQLQVALLRYYQFHEACRCVDRGLEVLEAVPMPWDAAKYEEALNFLANDRLAYYKMPPSPTAFHDAHPGQQFEYRSQLKAIQLACNVLAKAPSTYPGAGRSPVEVMNIVMREENTPALTTVFASLQHYLGLKDDPTDNGIDYEPIQRYRFTRDTYPPHAMLELQQLEAAYISQSEEERQRIEAAFASSDTVTVNRRSDIPPNLLDHNQYTDDEQPNVVATYEDKGFTWFRLPTNSCRLEAKAMGHCGTGEQLPDAPDQCLISLRKKRHVYVRSEQRMVDMWQPILTGSYDPPTGRVAELRGGSNTKPKTDYHPYIVDLIEKKVFRSFRKPSYLSNETFEVSDLPLDEVKRMLGTSPGLVPIEQIIFTEKYDLSPGVKFPWARERFEKTLRKGLDEPDAIITNTGEYWDLEIPARRRYADAWLAGLDIGRSENLDAIDFVRSFMANPVLGHVYYRSYDVLSWVIMQLARNPKTKPVLKSITKHLNERGAAINATNIVRELQASWVKSDFAAPVLSAIIPKMHQIVEVRAWFGDVKTRNQISNKLAIQIAEELSSQQGRDSVVELTIPDDNALLLSTPIKIKIDLTTLFFQSPSSVSFVNTVARHTQKTFSLSAETADYLVEELDNELEKIGKAIDTKKRVSTKVDSYMAVLKESPNEEAYLTRAFDALVNRAFPDKD